MLCAQIALNCAARSVRFSPSEARLNAAQTCRTSGQFDGYRACMGSIGAAPASKFSSTANRMSASRTPSRGTRASIWLTLRASCASRGAVCLARYKLNISRAVSNRAAARRCDKFQIQSLIAPQSLKRKRRRRAEILK